MRISDWSSDVCSSDLWRDRATERQRGDPVCRRTRLAERNQGDEADQRDRHVDVPFADLLEATRQRETKRGMQIAQTLENRCVEPQRIRMQMRTGDPIDRKSTRLNSSH